MAEQSKNNLMMVADKVLEAISPPKDNRRNDTAVPEKFFCPFSGALMTDPVILSNGQSYERSEIETWLKSGNTTCPVTKETLANTNLTPDHQTRVVIRDWCKKHNKSNLIQYNFLTPLYVRKEYFESLLKKLSSENLEDQKEAAKDVRKETTKWPYFRRLYVESPDAVLQLIAPLSPFDGNSEIDPHLEDDLIATLMRISFQDEVKKVISESLNGNLVLVEALQSDSVETQRYAAIAISQISTLNMSREIIGSTDAMVKLATLLVGKNRKLLCEDVTKTLFRLFMNSENKVKAVKQFADAGIFKKIEDFDCVDTLLPLFVSLSKIKEGLHEIEKYDCGPLFRVMRERFYDEDREYASRIVVSLVRKEKSKWKKMVLEEELENGTISEISRNGNLYAQKMAKAILESLKD